LQTPSATLTVVGVMPDGFSYPLDTPDPVEVWQPLEVTTERYSSGGGGMSRYFHLVGRLPPDGSPEGARAALDAASAPLRADFPSMADDWPPRVVSLYDSLFGHVRGWMLLVLAAVSLLMLVACANVANLLLVRSSARAREMSVRASLGASRRQLVTGLLAESVLLSLTAAVLGLTVASWGIGAARAALPAGIARADGIALDMRVLAAAIAAAAITGLAFGAVPAWQASRADLVTVLKETGPTMAGGCRRWRTAFVVFEVAFVAMLLVATTLVVSSFVNVTRADIGFERDRLIATDSVRFSGTIDSAIDTMQQVPGVESVGAIGMGSPPLIMRGLGRGGSSSVDLYRPDGRDTINAQSRRVSDSYFRAAGIALRRGAGFDQATGPSVILDERSAMALFPDRDPIGAIVRLGKPRPGAAAGDDLTVIGIVASVRMDGPEAEGTPQVYMPLVRRDGSTSPLPVLRGKPAVHRPHLRAGRGGGAGDRDDVGAALTASCRPSRASGDGRRGRFP
jgi:predicted permease